MFLLEHFEVSKPLLTLTLGLVIIVILNQVISSLNRIRKLPPGPWGLPIVGYLPFKNEDTYIFFDKLAKKYGPIFSLRLGQCNVIVICDWEHLKPALADDSLLARPLTTFRPSSPPSFLEMSGDIWREHRRLSLHILRDVGFGKSAMEELISKEIDQFLPTLEGQKVDFIVKTSPSTSNIISSFLFGKTFDYSDPTKVELDSCMEKAAKNLHFTGLQVFLPWLERIFATIGWGNKDYRDAIQGAENVIVSQIDEHLARKRGPNEIVDYIDGYLHEHDKRNSKEDETFDLKFLKRNSSSFFAAGYETIASTLSWAMLFIIHKPENQDKIRAEIGEVIGYDRKPNYTDRNQMPFTMAFLYETQRVGSVVATNLFRRATRDTKIGSYHVPKDTLVIVNFWSVNRDPKLWPEPEKFDPNRFLTDNGTKVVKPPHFVPFSAGKRACPGESLAKVELFLYLVSILQKYRVTAVSQPIDEAQLHEATFAITRRPKLSPVATFEKISP